MIANRVGPPGRGEDFYGREPFVGLVSDTLHGRNPLKAYYKPTFRTPFAWKWRINVR